MPLSVTLQPGLSLTLGSAQLQQPGLSLLSNLCSASSPIPLSPLSQPYEEVNFAHITHCGEISSYRLSSHIGTIHKTRNHAPNHPFSAYIYPLAAVTMFSTILHARSIRAQLIHAKHLILRQLESPSKCSPVYATAFLACTLSMAEKVVVTLRDCDKFHEHLITFSTYTLNRACIADSIEV